MAKMKYWNGTQWVPLDAADADTLEGLTVSQIRAGTTKTDVGLGNVDNVKQASKAEFDAHVAESAIHKTSDVIRTETKTKLKVEVVSSSVSETPDAGRIIFDTSQGKFFGGNGTEWV
jgi:hypothetical protein